MTILSLQSIVKVIFFTLSNFAVSITSNLYNFYSTAKTREYLDLCIQFLIKKYVSELKLTA
jgi:hypothetical protein